MKKFILSILFVTLGFTYLFAQEMTLRLEVPVPPSTIGDEFFVEIWIDVLDYPGYTANPPTQYPTLKSGQLGVWFDPAVLTPLKTPGPEPLQKYAWNVNQMFTDYTAIPSEGYPSPGDLRFVSYTLAAPGMDILYYGSIPFHIWDLKFLYNGGDITIELQNAKNSKNDKVINILETKEKIVTFWTAWDDASYAMTYVNYPTCYQPIIIGYSNVTSSSAYISWLSQSGLSNLEWDTSGFILGTGTMENAISSGSFLSTSRLATTSSKNSISLILHMIFMFRMIVAEVI